MRSNSAMRSTRATRHGAGPAAPALAMLAAGALLLAGCGSSGDGESSDPPSDPGPSESPSASDGPDPSEPPSDSPTDAGEDPGDEALAWGPTEQDVAEATELAASMTPEEVAGQVIIARYPGTDPAAAADELTQYHLGGLVLFSDNIDSLDQVVATSQAVQDAQADLGRDWPAILSVDNEGGTVQRLSADAGPWTSFPEFMAAGAANDPEVTRAAAEGMATELRASGLNVDFAPVADVTIGPTDAAIGTRSAGGDPQLVADTVASAVEGFTDGAVVSSLKHFPGHGGLTVDSHQDLPVQDATADELGSDSLVPFQAGVDAEAGTVMIGHIAVDAWDPGVPASLSPAAYEHLREDLGFTGVAITDGLDMGALTNSYTPDQIAIMSLQAGADLLLGPTDVAVAHQGIVDALADGSLSRDRVDEAAGRVIALMRWQQDAADTAGAVGPEESEAGAQASEELSRAAITQVAGECGVTLAGPRVHVHGGSVPDWDAFTAAAQDAGLEVVPLEEPADTEIRLLTSESPTGTGDVVVTLDGPWLLDGNDAPVELAAYGHTSGTFEALADVLVGAQEAPGVLPFQEPGSTDPGTSCG